MPVLKWQVNSASNFALFFIVMTHSFSVNFDPIKVPILKLSNVLVKICQISHVIFQTSQFFFQFCITIQCHERQLPCTFLNETLNTLHNRNKWVLESHKQILGSNFSKFLSLLKQHQFFFKFCINLQGHET